MEPTNKPLISVVIPVYNEEARVGRAIRSMLDQTWKNLEVIVVDDHSTDGTAEVIKEMAQKDPRLSYHLLPGRSPNRTNWRGYDINAGWAARAYGFKIAKGDWITTQDSDDATLLNRIEVEYFLAQKYSATMVSVTWLECKEDLVGKTLDVEHLIKDKGEEAIVIRPAEINKIVSECYGPLMHLPFHRLIPFPIKWFPWTRWLFWGTYHNYPGGSDNSVMFKREIITKGINLRARNERTWGVPSGRGSGRDFLMHTAHALKNNWSFRLPLYLWDVRQDNPEYPVEAYREYIK